MTEHKIEKRGAQRARNDDTRAAESLARAEARAREIRGVAVEHGENRDKFWAPEPPDGWDYQWKRKSVFGQEDPHYEREILAQGWTPVPLSRHPEMMPPGWAGTNIETEGLALMERPLVFTKEARERERREAVSAVRSKEMQLGVSPQGQFARSGQKVSKGYEPIPNDE